MTVAVFFTAGDAVNLDGGSEGESTVDSSQFFPMLEPEAEEDSLDASTFPSPSTTRTTKAGM